jgi:hypothetical protein
VHSAAGVGQDELAAGQAPERGAVVRTAAEPRFEAGQPLRVLEEMRGPDRVMADQAEQRRAVALPVLLAQRRTAASSGPDGRRCSASSRR